MNFQLQDSQKVSYQLTGTDSAGVATSTLPDGSTLTVASSDQTLAQVVPDSTPAAGSLASGNIVAQPKTGTVQINATLVAADGTTVLATGSVSIDIVAGALANITVNLGTPVAQ